MTVGLPLLFEALGIAIGLAAIGIGWSSFGYTERAQPPFSWSGLPAPNWDLSAEISEVVGRTRATMAARTLYAIAALLSTTGIAIDVAAAHSDNHLVLIVSTAIALSFIAGAITLYIRHVIAMRVSAAREAFDRFYVGTGLCKYEKFEPALARFARENPRAHRIAHRSLIADQTAAAAEHERQMETYVKAMDRALA